MQAPSKFYGPTLKLKRAEHHVDSLRSLFDRYSRAEQKALRARGRGRSTNIEFKLGKPLPANTATVIGDALHNMRVALDHAYALLVEANGCDLATHPQKKNVRFPFTDSPDWQSLRGSIMGHAKQGIAPSQAAIDHIFNVVQPYRGGAGNDLVDIHLLDIADKHLTLLPMQHGTHIHNIETEDGLRLSGFSLWRAASPNTPVTGDAISLPAGTRLKSGVDNRVSFDICFGRGQPCEGRPVLHVLDNGLCRVRETLKGLRPFLSDQGR